MLKSWKIVKRILGILAEILGAIIAIYTLAYLLISPFTLPPKKVNDPKTNLVYITTNGIHTDLLIPIHHPQMDWEQLLEMKEALLVDTFQTHFKFGWGDRNFFMRTREWSDLTTGTIVQTLFGKGPGAMHLVLCTPKDLDHSQFIPLYLTKQQYDELCKFIRDSFLWKYGHAQRIVKHPYGSYDFFFESSLDYTMLYTCNSWTNEALKVAGQKACIWTPFKGAIYAKYGR